MTKAGRNNRRKMAAAAALALGFGVGGYAFTASNTVPDSKAGDGSGAISGYTVSNVDYTLNATDPTTIDTVEFTLDSAPVTGSEVTIQLDASSTDWYPCTMTGADASCDTTGAAVVDADNLRVVVAD